MALSWETEIILAVFHLFPLILFFSPFKSGWFKRNAKEDGGGQLGGQLGGGEWSLSLSVASPIFFWSPFKSPWFKGSAKEGRGQMRGKSGLRVSQLFSLVFSAVPLNQTGLARLQKKGGTAGRWRPVPAVVSPHFFLYSF